MEALGSAIIFLNPAVVPVVLYEYLFCHLTRDQLRSPARRKAQGLLSMFVTLGTMGHRLWPNNLDMTSSSSGKTVGELAPHTRDDPTTPG
jgi:hypothetical protein